MRTIWLSPTDFVTGDPALQISYPFVQHPSTIVTCPGCTTPGDLKWIWISLRLPANVSIEEVIICYQLSNQNSFISQVRLVEMRTPDQALVQHDDPTDLRSTSPKCYSSKVSGFVPTAAVTLALRLNFQDTQDRIMLGAVGVTVQSTSHNDAWTLAGNASTNPPTNFLGTTDDQPLVIKTNDVEAVRVNTDGKVGIGTSNPSDELHVRETLRATVARFEGNGQGSIVFFDGPAADRGRIGFGTAGHIFSEALPDSLAIRSEEALHLGVSSSVVMTFREINYEHGNGYIGIGTTEPDAILTVAGEDSPRIHIKSNSPGPNPSRTWGLVSFTDGNFYITDVTGLIDRLVITKDGVVRIAGSLEVKGPRPWVDVRAFGAKGDGETDDTAAILAAIDSVPPMGGTVLFPPGTYIVSRSQGASKNAAIIIDRDFVRLLGSGSSCTIIKARDASEDEPSVDDPDQDDPSNFESTIYAENITGVQVIDLTVDSNQARRFKKLKTRTVGIDFQSCIESKVSGCVIKNNIGAAPGPKVTSTGVGISYGNTTRCVIESSIIEDSGVIGAIGDGCYTSGNQNLIIGCIARNCRDTGFVLEASNQSGIIGCTAVGCSAGAAITNFLPEDHIGNFIDGLTIYDWNAAVTGGICVGVMAGGEGNLVNTRISNVLLERKEGDGPALHVQQLTQGAWKSGVSYKTGETATSQGLGYIARNDNTDSQPPNDDWSPIGRTIGLTLEGIQIKGAKTQGIVVWGGAEQVLITGCHISQTQSPGIQVQPGCSKVFISNNYLATETTNSVTIDSADDVTVCNNVVVGNSVIGKGEWNGVTPYAVGDWIIHGGSAYAAVRTNVNSQPPSIDWAPSTANGVYFFNRCAHATALWNIITNMSFARCGSDPDTTPTILDVFLGTTGGILFGKQADVNLYRPTAGVLQTDGALAIGAGTPIAKVLSAIVPLDFDSTNAQTSADAIVMVIEADVGDVVALGVPSTSVLPNSSYSAWVSAANTVTVRFSNHSSGTLSPASGNFRVAVIKF